MDKNKAIVLGVLVVLVAAIGLMKMSEQPPAPAEQPEQTAQEATDSSNANAASSSKDAATAQNQEATATHTDGGAARTGKKIPDAKTLQKIDLKVGKGKVAKTGDHVVMQYRGTLTDGTVFDESYKRGQPFDFTIGAGQVIRGWDEGIPGMREGGKRKLIIPPDMGYGPGGQGPIPPNATLIFEVELVKVG